jgi:uncharacterized delta-60 repeat protein
MRTLGGLAAVVLVACGSDSGSPGSTSTPPVADAGAGGSADASTASPSAFSISVSPTTLVFGRGESAPATVTTSPNVVAVTVSGVPAGVVASASGGTLTVAASNAAAVGSTTITLEARDGTGVVRATANAQIVVGGEAGAFDSSFGTNGILTFDAGASADRAHVVLTQPDGKILLAGGVETPGSYGALARYDAAGVLDSSFGIDGKVTIADQTAITGIALQADGKIVVTTAYGFHVDRLNADGSIDSSFKRNPYPDYSLDAPYLGSAEGVAIQPDGKIVVVGTAARGDARQLIVMRLNADGSQDGTFGKSGIEDIPAGVLSEGSGIALVTNGTTTTNIIVTGYGAPGMSAFSLVVARLKGSDGAFDTTFGGTGVVYALPNQFGYAAPVVVQSDGKIVVGGSLYSATAQQFVLLRFGTDGSLDTSFDSDGMMTIPFNDFCQLNSIALQADGKVVAAGVTWNGAPAYSGFALARVGTDGKLDPTFNQTGTYNFDVGVTYDQALGITIDANQKILVVGSTQTGKDVDFATVRLGSDGAFDGAFGTGGKVFTPIGTGDDEITASALQSDGSLIVAGYAYDGTSTELMLAKVTAAGALDPTFGKNGVVLSTVMASATAMAVQDDGKIVVTGPNFLLARFLPNGDLDTAFGTNSGHLMLMHNGTAIAIQGGKIFVTGDTFGVDIYDANANGASLGYYGSAYSGIPSRGYAYAITLDANNELVIAGRVSAQNTTSSLFDLGLGRFTQAGDTDPSFGTSGLEQLHVNGSNYARAVAVGTDGKIVVGGYSDSNSGDFVVARFTKDGKPDPSFHDTGTVSLDLDGYDALNAVVVQPDGKIVAAGSAYATHTPSKLAMVRYATDGTLDPTFATTGISLTPLGTGIAGAQTLVRRPDGRLVLSGFMTSTRHDQDAVVVQYWP